MNSCTPDYEEDYDRRCPKCGHTPTRFRDCLAGCDDGYFDLYEDDPINYMPGEEGEICTELSMESKQAKSGKI